jgi:hypothetical protein
MNLKDVWLRLEEDQRANPGTGRMQRRILPELSRDFFLGLELPSRNRMLILRVSPPSVVRQTNVPESHGLKVRIYDRATDPPTAEVELVLTDQQHLDIFNLLIEDLVNVAEQQKDERASVGRFLARLTDWQRLLMKLAPAVITNENQQGLWGELWTLREVVSPAIGFASGMHAWRGPLGANQDFQFSNTVLEVKTSTASVFERLVIASELQLDVAQDTSLTMIALALDARPNHGESLADIVRDCRSIASNAGCLQILEDRLTLLGYRNEDTESYSNIGYAVRSRLQFRIQDGFPRIVLNDLRVGVGEVRYSISLAACSPFAISEGELSELLRRAP